MYNTLSRHEKDTSAIRFSIFCSHFISDIHIFYSHLILFQIFTFSVVTLFYFRYSHFQKSIPRESVYKADLNFGTEIMRMLHHLRKSDIATMLVKDQVPS